MSKLYVWTRVLKSVGYGMAFALADSEDEARRMILGSILAQRADTYGPDHADEFPLDHGLNKPADRVHEFGDKVAYVVRGSD